MWPECINHLTPSIPLQEVPDDALTRAFRECGWPELTGELPVRPVALLGSCSTAAYPECPNNPYREYADDAGLYFWFDFDLVGTARSTLKLRAVYNIGEADRNDGFWGAVWDRDKGTLVANIDNVGDCQTGITVVSAAHEKKFKPRAQWKDAGGNPPGISFGKNSVVERLIGVALNWHLCLGNEEDY